MKNKIKQIIISFFFLSIIICCITSCVKESKKAAIDINSIKSYKDLPFVTDYEVTLIEALKSKRSSFSFGQLMKTKESFMFLSLDGTSGFTTMLCNLLTGLFDIPFEPNSYTWESLKNEFDSKKIDFTTEITPTSNRVTYYYMTFPIAQRSLGVFTYNLRKDPVEITNEKDLNNLKIGFLEETTLEKAIYDYYPDLFFKKIEFKSISALNNALKAGAIDAYILDDIDYFEIKENNSVAVTKNILPLAYNPISIATSNSELEPIIIVLNKYISSGGSDKIFELYKTNNFRYEKYELRKSFSKKEVAYLNNIEAKNSKIRIALEYDNYPKCFYNENEKEFQGIVPDILAEISLLTGIQFEIVNDKTATFVEMLEMLKNNEVSLISELMYAESMKDYFYWTAKPYAVSQFALLSKIDVPRVEMFQIVQKIVGVDRESANAYAYNDLFSDNNNIIFYDTTVDAQDALIKGEVDLLMSNNYGLLAMTNYREKTGYKINLNFEMQPQESYFGFNKDEEILSSIFSKAQSFINVERIGKTWENRVFDYSRKLANQRIVYFRTGSFAILFIFLVLVFLFFKNLKLQIKYKEQASTISTIFNTIPAFIYSKDLNYKYTNCNDSFGTFLNLSRKDIIGKTVYDLEMYNSKKIAKIFTEEDNKVLTQKITTKNESWLNAANDAPRLYEIIRTPLLQKGKPVGILGVMTDITEHRAVEEAAQQASLAKSSFLAHMSHELRTPLNAIIGMNELILKENIPKKVFEYTQLAKQSGENMKRLINDILDFSKIEAGKLDIIMSKFSIHSLCNDIINIAEAAIDKKPLLLITNIDCNIPDTILGDVVRAKQVLLNVINNAIKYTNEGLISIIAIYHKKGNIPVIQIDVSDSGIGIKKENIDKLFTSFTRFDTQNTEGTGLGLAITKKLCNMLGGRISVKSEYGIGSTFTVTFPIKLKRYKKLAEVKDVKEKSVLLYETRSPYSYSLCLTFDNLGVNYEFISSKEKFDAALKNREYSFVFIPSFFFDAEKEKIRQFETNAKIVLILDYFDFNNYGEDIAIIKMPAYSFTVAKVLNNEENDIIFNGDEKADEMFIAPSASVLIVDDINTNLVVAEGLLSLYKMQIETSRSGMEAIELVKNNKYDIIFMDHAMPGMDGIEATGIIRSLEDGKDNDYYKNIPIVALTANAVFGMKEMFLENKMNDFLAKPIEVSKLNKILKEWIPKEKQIKQEEPAEKNNTDNLVDLEIEDIDTQTGLAINGYNIDNYFRALEIFCNDIIEKITEIKNCLKENNIQLYATYVHALKSASFNVGAKKLSGFAKNLENAGKKADSNFITEHNDTFLANLEKLYNDIQRVLLSRRTKERELTEYDLNVLKDEFHKLKNAIDTMEIREIDNIIFRIETKNWNAKINGVIKNISRAILLYEYDKAIELIDNFEE